MTEQAVLMAVRLKGRVDAATAARCAGLSEEQAQGVLDTLLGAGLVKGGPAVRITPEGRARLAELAEAERATVDAAALEAAYEDFHAVNDALKDVVTAWQVLPGGTTNDHTDAGYDAAVVERLLTEVDPPFRPILRRCVQGAPRLATYETRFDTAVAALRAGDTTFLAKPLLDSYHTVWFELHEELIGLLGRTRADEALAGRAV